jgi:hypothetical protein
MARLKHFAQEILAFSAAVALLPPVPLMAVLCAMLCGSTV